MAGHRDVLGLWAGSAGGGESAKYWIGVLTDLKNRGVGDIFFVVCDGLKGLPHAVNSAFLESLTCGCAVRNRRPRGRKSRRSRQRRRLSGVVRWHVHPDQRVRVGKHLRQFVDTALLNSCFRNRAHVYADHRRRRPRLLAPGRPLHAPPVGSVERTLGTFDIADFALNRQAVRAALDERNSAHPCTAGCFVQVYLDRGT